MLILMIGIPGSGKTTLRSKIFPQPLFICPDDLIGYTEKNPWTPRAAQNAWKESDQKLKEALVDKDKIIVFDATFVNPKKRKKYIDIAHQYDHEIMALFCTVQYKVAIQRNASRSEARKVPKTTMENMYDRLIPPDFSEGFDYVLTFNSELNNLKGKFPKNVTITL